MQQIYPISSPFDYITTIIIPTFKPGKYIFECIDSVCNQTLTSDMYEIIIVINGCNEPYYSDINHYISLKHYRNVIVQQTDDAGVSNARNIGIEKSKGEFLTFVDDDDVISSNYLEELIQVSSIDCVGCSNSYTFSNNLDENWDNFLTDAFNSCKGTTFDLYNWRKFLSPPVGKLIHRNIIANERFPLSISRSEDSVFCMKIARHINNMRCSDSTCVYYIRKRKGSVTRRTRPFYQEIHTLLQIEKAYITEWVKHPFSYSIKFVCSRIVAAIKNFMVYCIK